MNSIFNILVNELNTYLKEVNIDGEIGIVYEENPVLDKYIFIFEELFFSNIILEERDIVYLINILKSNKDIKENEIINFYTNKHIIYNTFSSKKIYPKTFKQYEYLKAIEENEVIFGMGSAGTGKTYLAMAYACKMLKQNLIKRIVITRPAVEAGEKLGFLPGDLKEKVDPYLIPIYDALNEFLGVEAVDKLIEKKVVEIAPLAYMRGRTLDNAFIILDEAQNTSTAQMKMFLTRLGFNSKMVITGDESQIDLPKYTKSGLIEANEILKGIPGVKFVEFTSYDVMRNPIVSKIIDRYEKDYNSFKENKDE